MPRGQMSENTRTPRKIYDADSGSPQFFGGPPTKSPYSPHFQPEPARLTNPPSTSIPRLALLRRLGVRPRLAAIAAALPHSSATERATLGPELLELALEPTSLRDKPASLEALGALLAGWSCLDEDTRHAAAAVGRGRWLEAIAHARPGTPERARIDEALPAAASEMLEPELLRPIGALLGPESPASRHAERAVLSIVRFAIPPGVGRTLGSFAPDFELVTPSKEPGSATRPPIDAEAIIRDLGELAWQFPQHRSRPVLLAALLLSVGLRSTSRTEGRDRLDRLMDQSTHPSAAALRGVLRWSRSPASRALAVRALATPAAAKAARDRLSRAESEADHESVARLSHLLLHPARRAILRQAPIASKPRDAGVPDAPLPDEIAQGSMSVAARRGLPRLVEAIAPCDTVRRGVLGPMLADEDDAARHAAMRAETGAFQTDYCFDPSEPIARSATLARSRIGIARTPGRLDDARLWNLLSRSPHASVRRIAAEEAWASDPWNHRSPAGRLAARRLLAQRGESHLAELRRRLVSGAIADRMDTVLLARSIGVIERIGPELVEIVRRPCESGSPEARLCATACAALAALPGDDAVRALNFCLSHADDRVRANALDALHAQRRRRGSVQPLTPFVELKSDPNHRVRGGAVRALLESESRDADAPRALVGLLGDVRTPHRDAGLWALERTLRASKHGAIAPVESMVADLLERMESDGLTAAARGRLDRCRESLRGGLRERWGRSAGAGLLDGEPGGGDA